VVQFKSVTKRQKFDFLLFCTGEANWRVGRGPGDNSIETLSAAVSALALEVGSIMSRLERHDDADGPDVALLPSEMPLIRSDSSEEVSVHRHLRCSSPYMGLLNFE